MEQEKEASWIKHYWRPVMAYQYAVVCVFDFIIGPLLTLLYFKTTGGEYVQWEPLTLKESGFYHLSMAAIIGVAAWTRGQEKIKRILYDGEEETVETTTTSQTPN
jgi:hypothetical protein